MKYKEWLNEWLELFVKSNVKIQTYNKYKQQVCQYIYPHLGNYEISNIPPIALQLFIAELQQQGLSANTVNGIISVLKNSLCQAVRFGVCEKQFTNSIIRPKGSEKNIECFTNDEQKKIEHYILSNKKTRLFGIILCLYTGLRIGELLALKWQDIDFDKGIIIVTKTCRDSWNNGKYIKIIDTPKTISSRRVIPIPNRLITLLKMIKEKSGCNYVVEGRTEYGAEIRSYQRSFEVLLNKLNLPHKGFHFLRHTFATRALECGMDVKTLSEILGHKNPTITLKRYVHSLLEHKVEMMNRVGNLLS